MPPGEPEAAVGPVAQETPVASVAPVGQDESVASVASVAPVGQQGYAGLRDRVDGGGAAASDPARDAWLNEQRPPHWE